MLARLPQKEILTRTSRDFLAARAEWFFARRRRGLGIGSGEEVAEAEERVKRAIRAAKWLSRRAAASSFPTQSP